MIVIKIKKDDLPVSDYNAKVLSRINEGVERNTIFLEWEERTNTINFILDEANIGQVDTLKSAHTKAENILHYAISEKVYQIHRGTTIMGTVYSELALRDALMEALEDSRKQAYYVEDLDNPDMDFFFYKGERFFKLAARG